jgi:hypothetical protein
MKEVSASGTHRPAFQRFFLVFLIGIMCSACTNERLGLKLEIETDSPQVVHGLSKLNGLSHTGLVKFTGSNPDYVLRTVVDEAGYNPEAFEIFVENKLVEIRAGDQVGLMYGLLDVKEQLESGGKTIVPKSESPHLPFRAIKFNLPWMSYRTGEALQLHSETCRDTSFWHDFLDMMAENRFNKLTLWSQHPFHYMVKTEKYPEACSLSDEELADWQLFWKTLFRKAKQRGIETYMVNWNIFVSPEFASAHGVAQYSIKNDYFINLGDTSELVKDYTRESVKAVIDTYPDLTGLGITLGEGMGGMTAEEREQWLLDSFISGARMASRKIKFIHRVPLSADKGSGGSTAGWVENMTRETLDTLSCFEDMINIELKFNWSHAYSTPKLVKVHGGELTDAYWNPFPENYRLAWMMRNEDFFVLRWGQPDFIRRHIAENVHTYVNGYYVGSECYIPAKDYITSLDGTGIRYAFERQWMYYKNWGRLLYDPATPDAVFEQTFINRFPEHGKMLFDAQVKVSLVPLIIASYWNATWDFTLYSEGMLGMENNRVKLLSLQQMSNKKPMEPTYLSIREFLANGEIPVAGKITPVELADSIESFCLAALKTVETIKTSGNVDLLYEVSDIQAWAWLGLYFSNKLRAAVDYKKYLESRAYSDHQNAVRWLEKATENWKRVVQVTRPVYQPMPLMHFTHDEGGEYFHWSVIEEEVIGELDWLKSIN